MITIVNESGVGYKTQILTDGGEDISDKLGIESLSIEISGANEIVRAKVVLGFVRVEIKAKEVSWRMRNPITGQIDSVKSIMFDDGTSISVSDDGGVSLFKPQQVRSEMESLATLGDECAHLPRKLSKK